MIYTPRRSYSAPAAYMLGGGLTEGMDTSGRGDLPPSRAVMAQNMWRLSDGTVGKRPGFYPLKRRQIPGRVIWAECFGGKEYLYYEGNTKAIRCYTGESYVERAAAEARFLRVGDKAIIFTLGAWLILSDKVLLVTAGRVSDITADFGGSGTAYGLRDMPLTVPLIRAGTSPTGKGARILPPNLLTGVVQESFVYTPTDKEKKRSRFCLAEQPKVEGRLPTESDGTHDNLSSADQAVRVASLTAACKLEIRVERSDAYGNTESYWTERPWVAQDNISVEHAAVWLHNISAQPLCYDGDDNIRMTYCIDRSEEETASLLNSTAVALFGVGGSRDRVFAASGRRIRYSGLEDPLYFGSLQYVDVSCKVDLLAADDTTLYALTDGGAHQIRGQAETSVGEYALDAAFAVSCCLPAPAPTGRDCVIAGRELLYYSREGLCAVTPSGVLDERCVQLRSRRLEGLLRQESAPRLWAQKDWLFLCGDRGVYLFDLQRRVKIQEDTYSSHGYEGYYWTGLEAQVFVGENLFYRQGDLYALRSGEAESDYHDEYYKEGVLVTAPIHALWQTGRLSGGGCGCFYGLILRCRGATAARVSFLDERGLWRRVADYDGSLGAFAYGGLRYGQFCYGGRSEEICHRRLPLHHHRQVTLRLENDVFDQPFRLETFILEYK